MVIKHKIEGPWLGSIALLSFLSQLWDKCQKIQVTITTRYYLAITIIQIILSCLRIFMIYGRWLSFDNIIATVIHKQNYPCTDNQIVYYIPRTVRLIWSKMQFGKLKNSLPQLIRSRVLLFPIKMVTHSDQLLLQFISMWPTTTKWLSIPGLVNIRLLTCYFQLT